MYLLTDWLTDSLISKLAARVTTYPFGASLNDKVPY